jgi:hypothetical protein
MNEMSFPACAGFRMTASLNEDNSSKLNDNKLRIKN